MSKLEAHLRSLPEYELKSLLTRLVNKDNGFSWLFGAGDLAGAGRSKEQLIEKIQEKLLELVQKLANGGSW